MAESSLSLTFHGLRSAVGYKLGYGTDSSVWTANQTAEINGIVASGLRQFYNPPPLRSGEVGHVWSFLRLAAQIEMVADQGDYTAPDDFGGLDGPITYEPTVYDGKIVVVPEWKIREMRQSSDLASYPRFVAVRPKSSTGSSGQRFEFMFFPVPDAGYLLNYRYHFLANAVDASYPYPMGGQPHAETILESCLAIAETRSEDGVSSVHRELFAERLAASVAYDKRVSAPDCLGYNGDNSDRAGYGKRNRSDIEVTYNGVSYE